MAPQRSDRHGERGMALIMTMLVMMLMSVLMIGFTTAVMSDQRYRYVDRDRVRSFYAAQSGIEKLSADLATLFFTNVAPSNEDLRPLNEDLPEIPGVTFLTTGSAAYGISKVPTPKGKEGYQHITTGPYQGLIALKTTYNLDAAARTAGGGETHLRRRVETVAIPVFQFGIFSTSDLSFHAGANFNFGGRVHTNGNLFLAQGGGNTSVLTLSQKVTAVGEVIRTHLANGRTVQQTGHTQQVVIGQSPPRRPLELTEGSMNDFFTAKTPNEPLWTTRSLSTYAGFIRNWRTGATALNLPIAALNRPNSDIVKRPLAGEDTSNASLFDLRYFRQVSLRILLSDRAEDITSLPGVTSTPPVELTGDWRVSAPNNGTAYGPVDATHPPIALSPGQHRFTVTGNSATNTGGTINASNPTLRTMRVAAGIPPYFQIPATITVRVGGVDRNGSCTTGKTARTFMGCTFPTLPNNTNIPDNSVVRATVDGVTVTTQTDGSWNYTAGGTMTVDTTLPFSVNTFWVNDTNILVTCGGYTNNGNQSVFTECNVPENITTAGGRVFTTAYNSNAGISPIGGFLKIELQTDTDVWSDVTMEILNWGIAGPNLAGGGKLCPSPNPNAIIRLQRLRDNNDAAAMPTAAGSTCSYPASLKPSDYWPNVLFDAREAAYRDTSPGTNNLRFAGIVHYVTLDVDNLSKWLRGDAPYAAGSGQNAHSTNGFSVYFSDRRNNRDASNQETGEYGYEDVINPDRADGSPNGTLDEGEDVDLSGDLQTYGGVPSYNGVAGQVPPCDAANSCSDPDRFVAGSRPETDISASQAKVNRAIFFRRALKLINGASNIVKPGLTIFSENPVYVQGDWNANATDGFDGSHAATAIISDAVTILSNAWTDNNSFSSPYAESGRNRSAQSYYRFAVIAGKNAAFMRSSVAGDQWPQDFGTDGGAHNFLRMLEGNGGTVNYRGSIATFYFARQAVGVYKAGGGVVYDAPTRNFNFDTDFLNPAKLPPLTPVFRDINALGFTQELRPGR